MKKMMFVLIALLSLAGLASADDFKYSTTGNQECENVGILTANIIEMRNNGENYFNTKKYAHSNFKHVKSHVYMMEGVLRVAYSNPPWAFDPENEAKSMVDMCEGKAVW